MKKLLMIPGPTEFDKDVLAAMGEQTLSHVSPEFTEIFADALDMMRKVWMCPDGQPFIMAGSGTLLEVAGPLERYVWMNDIDPIALKKWETLM